MNEEKVWILMSFVGGTWLLWRARGAWQGEDIPDYSDDNVSWFSKRREPAKFLDQWIRLVIAGLIMLGVGVWMLLWSFRN